MMEAQRTAVRWWEAAGEQGDVNAQYNLGVIYGGGGGGVSDGSGGGAVAVDTEEAAKWLRRAAAQGLPQAQTALDDMIARR